MKSKIAMFNLNSKSTFSAILLSLTLMVAALWVSPAVLWLPRKRWSKIPPLVKW